MVFDPFAGNNVTGEVCERLRREWISVEIKEEYLEGSKFRFGGNSSDIEYQHSNEEQPNLLQSKQKRLFEHQSSYNHDQDM